MSAMYSRRSQPLSPTSIATPLRPTDAVHSNSSQTSYSPTVTSATMATKTNVVTRVAIRGVAERNKDGVNVEMYLKISLPLNNVLPGSVVHLFPEEDVKIHDYQVHPIDNESVPYEFSTTEHRLLRNASKALKLLSPSSKSFYAAHNLPVPSLKRGSSPVGDDYTGTILVNDYHIAFQVPKAFPRPRSDDTDESRRSRPSSRPRRASIGERNVAQFMATICLHIPYVSRPPRFPYLLSIPVPRCLHNHIKLTIFSPASTSTSFASLSSVDDEYNSWDVASEPPVTPSRRRDLHQHFADDESSDSSSTGFSSGYGIRGTFPSTERIRVRWADPKKTAGTAGSSYRGRQLVEVMEVKGEMTCGIRDVVIDANGADSILMDVAYKATCYNVAFPGVATLVGMRVGMETDEVGINWFYGAPSQWQVVGGSGYTGFDSSAYSQTPGPASRTSSVDSTSPQILLSPSTPDPRFRKDDPKASSSTLSLLHAPLPIQHMAEYSFEGSGATIPSASSSPVPTLSSISSLPRASTASLAESTPKSPITLHLNINELIKPKKNTFTFTISGTIVVVPKSRTTHNRSASYSRSPSPNRTAWDGQPSVDTEPVILPRFFVHGATSQSIVTIIRNDTESGMFAVNVYNLTGDIEHDAQARKTVLQRGNHTRCDPTGGRISMRRISKPNGNIQHLQPPGRPRTPAERSLSRVSSSSSISRSNRLSRPPEGPITIPSVEVGVTMLRTHLKTLPHRYIGRISFDVPHIPDMEWFEFGFAATLRDLEPSNALPSVHLVSAAIDGKPAPFESVSAVDENQVMVEKLGEKKWANWVRLKARAPGRAVVDYIIGHDRHTPASRRVEQICLPTFSLSIGRLDVKIDGLTNLEVTNMRSNLEFQQIQKDNPHLVHVNLPPLFSPALSFRLRKPSSRYGLALAFCLTWAILIVALVLGSKFNKDLQEIRAEYSVIVSSSWNAFPEPLVVTSTLYTNLHAFDGSDDRHQTQSSDTTRQTHQITPTPTDAPTSAIAPTAETSPMASTIQTYQPFTYSDLVVFSRKVLKFVDVKSTANQFLQTLDAVYQICRRIYHYPLEPS